MSVTVHITPPFAGFSDIEPGSHLRATRAMGTRRDGGRTCGMPAPELYLAAPSSPMRGAFFHEGSDGLTLLFAAGATLYRSGPSDVDAFGVRLAIPVLAEGGAPLALPGSGAVQFAQDGDRTFILLPGDPEPGGPLPAGPAYAYIPPVPPEPGDVDGGGLDTTPPAGSATVIVSEADALRLNITAGSDNSGAAPTRILSLYTSEATRDAGGAAGMVATYPRALSAGDDLFGYRADGLAAEAPYYGRVTYSDRAGNAYHAKFSGTTAPGGAAESADGGVPLMWDERTPDVAYAWSSPERPVITQIARSDYTNTEFNRPLDNYTPKDTNGDLGAGWTIESVGTGLSSRASWAKAPDGRYGLRVNTETLQDGINRIYVTESAPLNWSSLTGVTFKLYSGGNEKRTGAFLSFIFSEDGTTWTEIPFEIEEAGKVLEIEVPFDTVTASKRDAVTRWGFRWVDEVESVVNIWQVRSYAGLRDEFEYVLQLRRTLGDGTEAETALDGPESAAVRVETGRVGSKLTVSFDAIPVGYEGVLWRRDIARGATLFHYLATVAAGATAHEDTVSDISLSPRLKAGRAPIPAGASCMGFHEGRLLLYTAATKSLWASSMGRPDLFFDATPQMLSDLSGLIGPADGLRLPMGDAGPVVAIAGLGTWTGSQFVGDTLLMTDHLDIRLTGAAAGDLSIGFRRRGGCASALGWTRDDDGRVLKIDPQGQIAAVNAQLKPAILTAPDLEETLRGLGGRGDWRIGYDPAMRRVLLSCETGGADRRVFWLDLRTGTVDEAPVGSWGLPSALATANDGSGGRLLAGLHEGRLEWAAPASWEAGAWLWSGPDWTSRNVAGLGGKNAPVSIRAAFSGDVAWSVAVDGHVVWTGALRPGVAFRLPPAVGERIRISIAGTKGAEVHDVSVELARRV